MTILLNGEFPPQAGFSHKNLDPEAEGERIRVRRGCVTFEKGGGEQVAVVQFARARKGGTPCGYARRCSEWWQHYSPPHILTTKNQCRCSQYTHFPSSLMKQGEGDEV